MAFQKRGQQDKSYIADSFADLMDLPPSSMGSTCWVIETAEKYMANSKGEWVLQTLSTNGKGAVIGGGVDLSNYVTLDQMNETIAHMQAKDDAILEHFTTQDQVILEKVNNLDEESTVWNQLHEE